MPSPNEAATDDYFNDLSQQLPQADQTQPRSKRVACVLCRKRKLRCDGARPSCGTCTRLSHNCAYDEVRKKSGPKRGYVKELEARLAQVETLLKRHDSIEMPLNAIDLSMGDGEALGDFGGLDPDEGRLMHDLRVGHGPNPGDGQADISNAQQQHTQSSAPISSTSSPDMAWNPSLMATGADEPLPPPDVCAELTAIYFERAHPSAPLIHRPRFLMAMQNSLAALRPPLCLQYAIWALAATSHPKYQDMQDYLYRRARHYLERDEMTGAGEKMLSLATVQAWQCISAYEFKMMYFPRAWLSTGRTSRLASMMGLHRVDGQFIDVKQCLPPPKDWIEKEERRRLFWLCFAGDRYASIGTGWPMAIDEADIQTDLPASEDAYESGIPEPTISLKEALELGGAEGLSSMGAVGVIACLFGRNLLHLHRQSLDANDGDINGEFWKRHRQMDSIILNLLLCLPESLRLPHASHDPKVVFMNMCIHTSVICLHQAAIFKSEKHQISSKLATEAKMRCLTAAAEISSLMKMCSHLDMSQANPFMAFCLYVAARVFVQYLRSRPRDDTAKSFLHFLLSALQAMKKTNPLAESFIAQLDVDLEAAGLEDLRSLRVRAARKNFPRETACSLEDPAEAGPTRPPTYGDRGLGRFSNPVRGNTGLPGGPPGNYPKAVIETLTSHKGEFKGIFPVQVNMNSENCTANASPQTQGSSDVEIMELCSGPSGSSNNGSTPPTTTSNHRTPPTGFSPDSTSPGTSTLTFRQPMNTFQQQPMQSQQPVQPHIEQTQRLASALLPNMTDFSQNDFMGFDKSAGSTVLDLGAVDETQLFQLSEAEWGQVLREFPQDSGSGGQMEEMQFTWQGGARDTFGL